MSKIKREVYCSAGISHLLLYPNGDVYRCMADYNEKRPPLFNAKDGWKKISAPMVCTHEKCYAACDIDWAKKWVFEPDKKEPQEVLPQAAVADPGRSLPWGKQSMDKPLQDRVHIVWAPTLLCNYNCQYCGCAAPAQVIRDTFASSLELAAADWVKIWNEIDRSYAGGIITTGGGEPLLSKATIPILEKMSSKFYISLTTNLSVHVMALAKSEMKIGGEKASSGLHLLTASMHVTSRDFSRDLFMGSALFLKQQGFPVCVNFVGYPLQLYLAPEYKEWFDKHQIPFFVSPWCGKDNDGFHAAYSNEENDFLNILAPQQKKTDTQVSFHSSRCVIKVDTQNIVMRENETRTISGQVTNTGDEAWLNEYVAEHSAFKVGARVCLYGERGKSLKEMRCSLPSKVITPGMTCDFSLLIDSEGIAPGMYSFIIDVVKEHAYWFEEKRNKPVKLTLEVVPAQQVQPSQAA